MLSWTMEDVSTVRMPQLGTSTQKILFVPPNAVHVIGTWYSTSKEFVNIATSINDWWRPRINTYEVCIGVLAVTNTFQAHKPFAPGTLNTRVNVRIVEMLLWRNRRVSISAKVVYQYAKVAQKSSYLRSELTIFATSVLKLRAEGNALSVNHQATPLLTAFAWTVRTKSILNFLPMVTLPVGVVKKTKYLRPKKFVRIVLLHIFNVHPAYGRIWITRK